MPSWEEDGALRRPSVPRSIQMTNQRRPFAARNALATAATSCPSITTSPTSLVTVSLESWALTASSRPPNLGVRLLGADHGRDVLRVLEVLVVEERDEPVHFDARIRREHQADLHLVALERGDGLRPSGVQRLEVLEEDAVDVPKAWQAEGSKRTLGRRSDRQPVGDGGEQLSVVRPNSCAVFAFRHELIRVLGAASWA